MIDQKTFYRVYFHGNVSNVDMTLEEIGPLFAHPLAYTFIDYVELGSTPSGTAEDIRDSNELPEMPKE